MKTIRTFTLLLIVVLLCLPPSFASALSLEQNLTRGFNSMGFLEIGKKPKVHAAATAIGDPSKDADTFLVASEYQKALTEAIDKKDRVIIGFYQSLNQNMTEYKILELVAIAPDCPFVVVRTEFPVQGCRPVPMVDTEIRDKSCYAYIFNSSTKQSHPVRCQVTDTAISDARFLSLKYAPLSGKAADLVSIGAPVINESGFVIAMQVKPDYAKGTAEAYPSNLIAEKLMAQKITFSVSVAESAQTQGAATQQETAAPQSGAVATGIDPLYFIIGGAALVLLVVLLTRGGKQRAGKQASSSVSDPLPLAADGPATEAAPSMPPPDATMAPPTVYQVVGTSGVYASSVFPVEKEVSFGRDSFRASIVFPPDTKGISALHCTLALQGGGLVITDQKSSYGTFVNGEKLTPHKERRLYPNDTFYLGSTDNSFLVVEVAV